MKTKPNRKFLGIWVPAEVWTCRQLTANEKVLLMDIHSLTEKEDGEFWKSNDTIAADMVCSVSTVKRAIKKLHDLGWIDSEQRGKFRFMWTTTKFKMDLVVAHFDPNQVQNEPQPGSKWTTSKTKSITKSKTESKPMSKKNKFISDLFRNCPTLEHTWEVWKGDRKDRKIKPYTALGEQMAIDTLYALSGGNCTTAIRIIRQSIANGYQGLFPLKNANGTNRPNLDRDAAAAWADQ